jgi:hypothetical protein
MASNGLSVAAGNADIDFYDGTETHGFICWSGSAITERRGSTFAQASGSGGATYVDAEPFSRQVWENFNGGFGQAQQNKVFGGTGVGGDPSRYFHSSGWTLKGNILLPGMSRDLIAPSTPVSGLATKWETPRGILPTSHPAGTYTEITMLANVTFGRAKFLLKFATPTATTPFTLTATINGTNFTYAVQAADLQATDFKWYNFAKSGGGTISLTSGITYVVTTTYNANGVIWGCFAGPTATASEVMQPYLQLCSTVTNEAYRQWTNKLVKMEQVITGSFVYNPIAITASMFYVPGDNTIAERALDGAYSSSMVFDNKLYIGTTGGTSALITTMWSAAAAIAGAAGTSNTTTLALGPAVEHEGMIYYVEGANRRNLAKWDGAFPATSTDIIAQDKIGSAGSNGMNGINNLLIHRGHLFAFKPEGVFWIYNDISKISTAEVPRIIKVVDLSQGQHLDNGKWAIEYQGMLYFNVRNQVYQLAISDNGNQVTVLVPPLVLGRFLNYHYVNGLSTNGDTLFISYANLGVMGWKAGTWHMVTEFYQTVLADGSASGLRFINNPGGTTDYLYVGDYKSLVRLPMPNLATDYSTQLYQNQQNKAFYHIISVFDGDLAEIKKYLRSFILRAFPSGWAYKLVGAFWQAAGGLNANYRTIIEKSLHEGLHRDRWISPQAPRSTAGTIPVITTKVLGGSGDATTTDAPCVWTSGNFNNAAASGEKFCSYDDVAAPVEAVSVAFILYGWNAQRSPG